MLKKRIINYCLNDVLIPEELEALEPICNGEILEDLTIIYPVYVTKVGTGDVVIKSVLEKYEQMSQDIKRHLKIVIVDDGSPVDIILDNKYGYKVDLLRIIKNIKWNSGGAKNLGVCFCSTERIIITDMDHFFPEECLRWCMSVEIDKESFMFERYIEESGELIKIKMHPNTFFMKKSTYFNIHGYDEDFCGMYGDDIPFGKRISRIPLYRTSQSVRVVKSNLNTHHLERRIPLKLYLLMIIKRKKGANLRWLNFEWKMQR